MQANSPKAVTVVSNATITPNMQRLVLQGEALASFPVDCQGGYIKLLFNSLGETDLSSIAEGERPVMRTYTIRRFIAEENAIEVDFVRHITEDKQCGFASRWAMNAQIGDTIAIHGPGLISSLNLNADWFVLAADMTALPALSVKIKQLPTDAKGYAVIHVVSEEDIQPLEAPTGIEVHWVTEKLADTVRALPWLDGQAAAWVACEFDSMRSLRQYLRNEKQIERDYIYISSYWKQGVAEDGHKVIKRQDAEENS